MQPRFLIVLALTGLVSLAGCTLLPATDAPTDTPPEEGTPSQAFPAPGFENVPEVVVVPAPTEFATEVKSPHFVSSTPKHASIVEEVPARVSIRFNFDVVAPSEMSLTLNGTEYGSGEVQYDADQLGMSLALAPGAPSGVYTVDYVACWPDATCHDGSFQFQAGLSL